MHFENLKDFSIMDGNKIMQQMTTIFSFFMVFFYIGVGSYLIFFLDQSHIDKATRTIIGVAFLFLGTYRAIKVAIQIKNFFNKETDNE